LGDHAVEAADLLNRFRVHSLTIVRDLPNRNPRRLARPGGGSGSSGTHASEKNPKCSRRRDALTPVREGPRRVSQGVDLFRKEIDGEFETAVAEQEVLGADERIDGPQ